MVIDKIVALQEGVNDIVAIGGGEMVKEITIRKIIQSQEMEIVDLVEVFSLMMVLVVGPVPVISIIIL